MEGKPCRYNNIGDCRVGKDQWMKHVISIQSKGFALRCLAKKDILIPVDTLEDNDVTEKISVKHTHRKAENSQNCNDNNEEANNVETIRN